MSMFASGLGSSHCRGAFHLRCIANVGASKTSAPDTGKSCCTCGSREGGACI